ncbi:hypothetical protein H8E52_03830 [bacterium]|nr:hypothetical protein [bacterium]
MRQSLLLIPLLAILACDNTATEPQSVVVDAVLTVSPSTGTILTDFVFDASETSTTSRALEFRWDWNNDGVWDTGWSGSAVATRRFENASVTVKVEARSGDISDTALEPITLFLNHGEQVGEIRVLNNILPLDITWDGSQFWVLGSIGSASTTINRINLGGEITTSYPALLSHSNGITWDGDHLWVTNNYVGSGTEQTLLFEVDPATGLNLNSYEVAYSPQPSGLVYRDGVFFHGGGTGNVEGDNLIHKYDAEANELLQFATPPGTESPRNLAFDGVDLWLVAYGSDSIFVVDAATGTVKRSFEIEGHLRAPFIVNGFLWLPFTEEDEGEDRLFLKKFVP